MPDEIARQVESAGAAMAESRHGLSMPDHRPAHWAMETRSLSPVAVCDRGPLGDGGVMPADIDDIDRRRVRFCNGELFTIHRVSSA